MSQTQFFITGTDTGVGKTLISVALVKAFQAAGKTAKGLKPVSAGCDKLDGIWQNEDAVALRAASSLTLEYEQINPLALIEPMAPHIAARRENRGTTIAELCRHIEGLPATDVTLIEGAGGWLVPVNDSETLADLGIALQTPVILVVGMRLGCINHSLLTAAAIQQAGLPVAGWVANTIDPDMAVHDENIEAIAERIDAPLLGRVPHMPKANADAAAKLLNVAALHG